MTLNMARALGELGFKTLILTVDSVDERKIKDIYGISAKGLQFRVINTPGARILRALTNPRSGLRRLRHIIAYRLFYELSRNLLEDFDLVVDVKSDMPVPADIVYIHYPVVLSEDLRGNTSRLSRSIWERLLGSFTRVTGSQPRLVLANSKWTALKVYEAYGITARVVYPPVDVEESSRYSSSRKDRMVVTVSRLAPSKHLDRIVDVAARLRDYTFVIAGTLEWRSHVVLERILEKIRFYRLNNVIVEPRIPRSRLLEYLGEARFYLHPELPEHFGISVVEAMAAGAVPIVYRDGGAWTDIVSRISPILGYGRIEEAADIIRAIDGNPRLYEELREKAVRLAREFSYNKFKRKIQVVCSLIEE